MLSDVVGLGLFVVLCLGCVWFDGFGFWGLLFSWLWVSGLFVVFGVVWVLLTVWVMFS